MKLHQRGMSVKDYFLKFTQHHNYAPAFVANSRYIMNMFVMEVSSMVQEECRTLMVYHDMNISRLMVNAQQIEESKLRNMNKFGKRAWSDETSKPKSKKRFYYKNSSM